MKLFEMSVAYKLQSENLQVFYNRDTESFICSKDVCLECNKEWFHSVNQCVFCGSENPFVWICSHCDHKVGLASSTPNPCKCGHNTLYKLCFNNSCPSRTDIELSKIIISLKNSPKGIFDKRSATRSGFTISQNFCKNCASENNYIRISEFKVLKLDLENIKKQYDIYNKLFDLIVFVNEDFTKFITIKKNEFNKEINDDINLNKFF
jgi:hypothetical protein